MKAKKELRLSLPERKAREDPFPPQPARPGPQRGRVNFVLADRGCQSKWGPLLLQALYLTFLIIQVLESVLGIELLSSRGEIPTTSNYY